ncbi:MULTISPECIES: N-acetyl-gamma-glutamyl-phosphate reductase [unclassified Campylobacter]|uniref:N-acetyl-gamma-glutamyl-phosphate reductase n=1 Tax=unclassified Campylobacter TaxID=2593542 RepID=UPI0012382056|nr:MULTISPECIES: N-acetyl-gamma-glutamyl-phosphate reductase [unclassified Campylobacter]KAA6228699.1 N-acetyl-gamma-glutamyl-phosphate reductase [Campylobacter sp. LR196d]KAA6229593.1 N-acetyl-gamma-glutamyl-phosphate reductase [Campylobacter sp. LR286c]KAA6231232.1 N-acetyl-gamma-glutamyl-phosphate reductase [Campylobacter sp. LR264d]KAA6233988.1 N-acetyl-gamma-glutamyl-phosphate reductase [Campylobacter sp. LR291e]
MKLRVGVLGASGYVGNELIRLLLRHKNVEITYIGSQNNVGENYASLCPNTPLNLSFENENLERVAEKIELLFCATPHNFTASILNENLLKKIKIIDLSADYRLKESLDYKLWYGFEHKNLKLLKQAVYGLCELYERDIKKAKFIANPGCYTTCSILSLYPLIKENLIDLNSIIIDAKSGVSGAGKGAKIDNLFCEVNENFKAYALTSHRHTPEIEEHLSKAAKTKLTLQFSPHLVPMQRGILATCYANLKTDLSEEKLRKIYEKHYKNKPFIRILPSKIWPQTRWVKNTNFVDINFCIDKRTKKVLVVGTLDNLIKGASGQAVQNMNLMYGFDECEGLDNLANL